MSPKPEESYIGSTRIVSASSGNIVVSRKASDKDDVIFKRHPDFLQNEEPLGLEFHTAMRIFMTQAHLFALYGVYLTLTMKVPLSTFLFDVLIGYISGLGITVGCHRYWAHKTFKATTPLRVIMMIMQTMALQNNIHKWSLDHRLHHKYTDTDADPHNSKRGFIFSHIGWFYCKKHPEYKKKMATFDMSDLEKDPIVRFQCRWYWTLVLIFHTIIPVAGYYLIWELPLIYCLALNYRRYVSSLQMTWCVNSVAHMFGDRPYDKSISPTDNKFVSLVAAGEGWHNYHHTFPWDYKASEFGWKINVSTMFIDFFAWIGWAYDLKTVSQKMLKDRLQRTGDGSHVHAKKQIEEIKEANDFDYHAPEDVTTLMQETVGEPLWGWDDDIPEDFRRMTKILKPQLVKS